MTFKVNDLVQVAKDLGPHMRHFTADCRAIVTKVSDDDYALYIEGKGTSAWYEKDQLTLIERNQQALLAEWEEATRLKEIQHSDLDWIFENGNKLLETGFSGASIGALAKGLGITNLWGSHGEGMTYYLNAMSILEAATPFLRTNDKAGWEAFAERNKQC